VAPAVVFYGCKEPVQVQLNIVSNLPCAAAANGAGAITSLRDVAIFAGPSEASVRARIAARETPSALIATCPQSGKSPDDVLGDIALVRGTSNAAFVAVVAGLVRNGSGTRTEKAASDCNFASGDTFASNSPECLIAVRQFVYPASNASSQLRVSLDASCLDIASTCKTGETCINGSCRSSQVNPDGPGPVPTSTTPPNQDASIDTGAPVVNTVFRCANRNPVWTEPLTCPSPSSQCVAPSGASACSNEDPACLTPCCSILPRTPTSPQVEDAKCCVIAVSVSGEPKELPLGEVRSTCVAMKRACFSAADCAACGVPYVSERGWGVCAN
jgi:hypothetical protein